MKGSYLYASNTSEAQKGFIYTQNIFKMESIKQMLMDNIKATENVIENNLKQIEKAGNILVNALKNGNKLLICGNGGSAAQSQHFAAEMVVKFERKRRPLPALALTTDSSNLTAGTNDLGFDTVFQRQVEAFGKAGDVLLGITTSGNSENVIKAFEAAKKLGVKCICLNGQNGGKISSEKFTNNLDADIVIKDKSVSRIQEKHITIIHIWCKLIEQELFGDG